MEKCLYDVILCDPPWFYNSRKTGGERKDKTKFGGGAMKHYPLMKDKELLAMAGFIESLKAPRCMMFMWVTMPRLDFGIELMKAWGFKYKTSAFTWVKPTLCGKSFNNGPGYYTASNTEIVLLGSCGQPLRPDKKMLSPIVSEPKSAHSSKPITVHERIELMYPNAKKIELFARQARRGWDHWGNEV